MNTATTLDRLDLDSHSQPTYQAPAIRLNTGISVIDESAMTAVYRFAEMMAKGNVTVPKHLQGNVGDCAAIVLKAQRWGMDPFEVAQKTHLVNGTLGYEAQLVAAVINSSSLLKGRLNFEWFGRWEQIIGKFKWMESKTQKDKHGNPSRYAVPAWDSNKDEEGLGVRCWGTLRGEDDARVMELLMLQARTRNSTLWAEDPKQQIAYLIEKRWARLHAPELLLGVYTPDELSTSTTTFMGTAEEVRKEVPSDVLDLAREAAGKGRDAFLAWWKGTPRQHRDALRDELEDLQKRATEADQRRTVDNPVAAPATARAAAAPAASAAPVAAPAATRARAPAPRAPAPQPSEAAAAPIAAAEEPPPKRGPRFTAEQVRQRLADAPDLDALYIAADLIGHVNETGATEALEALFEERRAALEG